MAEPITTREAMKAAVAVAPVITRRWWLIVWLNVGGTGVQVLIPVIIQQTVDRFVEGAGDVDIRGVLLAVTVGLLVIIVGALMSRAGLVRLVGDTASGLSLLRVQTFSHLLKRSVLHVEAERRGALVSRVTSDVSTVQEFLDWGGVMAVVNGTQAVVAIVVMVIYEWRLALVVVAGVTIYGVVLLYFQGILRKRYDIVRVEVANNLAVLGEVVTALPEVRAYGAEDSTMARVRHSLQRRFDIEYRTFRLGNFLFATSELFAATLMAVVLAVGLWIGQDGGLTAGVLLAFLFLVNLLVEPVQNLVEVLEVAQSAGAGVRRIADSLQRPVEIPDPTDPQPLPIGALDVSFEDVRYAYPGGPDVLSDLSVALPSGRRIAVVGQTGSGKTTFGKLLVRLLDPDEGTVRVGGADLREVAFADLRARVAFVPQEGFLFAGSIRDNVRFGRPGAGEREINAAFIELELDGWLEGLTEGLETDVGPRGSNLSAGERQLVALVRAWISTPDLLVLDEATSAVDPALDVQIRRAIDRLTAGRTSVTIAHRLATAEAADHVLVFDRGHLVEQGTHAELVAAGGVYAALYQDWTVGTASM